MSSDRSARKAAAEAAEARAADSKRETAAASDDLRSPLPGGRSPPSSNLLPDESQGIGFVTEGWAPPETALEPQAHMPTLPRDESFTGLSTHAFEGPARRGVSQDLTGDFMLSVQDQSAGPTDSSGANEEGPAAPVSTLPPGPRTPRQPTKRHPAEVRAALKSLRRALFLALKRKGQINGGDYLRALLVEAENYKPPGTDASAAKARTEGRTGAGGNRNDRAEGQEEIIEEIGEGGGSGDHELKYEKDGVKPHTRTQRSSLGSSPMRLVPASSPQQKGEGDQPKQATDPAVAVLPAESAPKHELPEGGRWEVKTSLSQNKEYYYNVETGESTWQHPGASPGDSAQINVKVLAIVDVLQKDLNMHLFKKDLRPLLLEFGAIANKPDAEASTSGVLAATTDWSICEDDTLTVQSFLEALNEIPWWPTEEQIEHASKGELSRVREQLDLILGPHLSAAMTDGKEIEYVKDLLAQAENDRSAVEELKAFLAPATPSTRMPTRGSSFETGIEAPVAGTPQENRPSSRLMETPMEISADGNVNNAENDTLSVQNTNDALRNEMDMAKQVEDGHQVSGGTLGVDDDIQLLNNESIPPHGKVKKAKLKRGISPFLAKVTKPIVTRVTAKAPQVKQSFPFQTLPPPGHIPARDPDVEWTPWVNPKTGKLHEPIPRPSQSRGSSRQRSAEYAKELGDITVDSRKQMQRDHEAYWRTTPSPSGPRLNAKEYRRWHHLDQKVPGWTPHDVIPTSSPKPWYEVLPLPHKMGSRFTSRVQRVSGNTPERLTVMTMLVGNLKEERQRANLVLDGLQALKAVRTLVQHDSFDKAVRVADESLQKFQRAGKFGAAYAKEIRTAEDYVIVVIKAEIDKLLAFAEDGIERSLCDKASQFIPKLRKACLWLLAKGVIYPKAREQTEWEKRNGISRDTFPEGVKAIDDITERVIKKAGSVSMSHVTSSLGKVFSSMRPEINLEDEATLQLVREAAAPERRNTLPSEIVTDGRTYISVFDIKSPDLPEQLKINERVIVGRDGEWMNGTITSFNRRTQKYKVQYEIGDEWVPWPLPEGFQLEIDVHPEEVVITSKGYQIRSITAQHAELGTRVAVVAFTFVPLGGDYSVYGHVDVCVKGLKSKQSLLFDNQESVQMLVLPPELLRPATQYEVYDSTTNRKLSEGIMEFVRQADEEVFMFQAGRKVDLEDGVYTMEARGNDKSGYPWSSHYGVCVVVQGHTRAPENQLSRLFLNRHIQSANDVRVVLSWGSKPLQLDAHLYNSEGEHVEYKNAGQNSNGIKFEMDTSLGYGPETATIKVSAELGYSFSVYWPGKGGTSKDWTESLATVTLYDTTGPFAVFHTPPPRLGAGEDKWWHVFGLDGSQWNSPGKGVVRVNQRMPHEFPQLALKGWTLIQSLQDGLWDQFCSQLDQIVHDSSRTTTKGVLGSGGSNDGSAHPTADQPCMNVKRLALMTSFQGSTLLSLLCQHNYDISAGDPPFPADESGQTPLEKQMKALSSLMTATVKLEKAARSLTAMDGGIPDEVALNKEIQMRGVRDTYIYKAVVHASSEVAVHILEVMEPVLKRASMSAPIRHFFYRHGDHLLESCINRRKPNHLLPVLQALLRIDAVWERRPIRRFLVGDRVALQWPPQSGDWVQGIVHECRYDVNVIRLDEDFDIPAPNLAHAGCQFQPADDGIVHDSLLGDKLVKVAPSRLKWTSNPLKLLKGLADKFQREARQANIGPNGATLAQKQILVAGSLAPPPPLCTFCVRIFLCGLQSNFDEYGCCDISHAADCYKKALKIMAEKAFVDEGKEKKRTAPAKEEQDDDF